MTKQESFKKRVRARMELTGERYAAARHALLTKAEQAGIDRSRVWASEPEVGDDAVRSATGRGWDEWCDLIDGWPGRTDGHPAIAAHLEAEHGLDGWWSQSVTGGYERITGLRLPHQQPDGTFTANKSKTVWADAALLRKLLLDAEGRRSLFPGREVELRSRPASKAIRLAVGPGVALLSLTPTGDNASQRVKITVMHEKLPTFDAVEEWKFYWADWLEAVDLGPGDESR